MKLDGHDLKTLNIGWLRHQIGVVSQEPVLFDTTVEKNIMYGGENVTSEEVIAAAKLANAHEFISKLPKVRNDGVKTLFFDMILMYREMHYCNNREMD